MNRGRHPPAISRSHRARRVTLTLAGCAIQPDSAPRDIPDDLLTPEVPSLSAEGGVAQGSDRIYLLSPDGTTQPLRTVNRETNNDPTLLLSELISGPNPSELEDGYRSAIPSTLQLHSVGIDAGVVQVDVNDALLDLSGGELTARVAQIVFTASEIPAAESVLIRVDGATQEWPDGSGSQHRGPLTTYDFNRVRRVGTTRLPDRPDSDHCRSAVHHVDRAPRRPCRRRPRHRRPWQRLPRHPPRRPPPPTTTTTAPP